VNAVLDYELRSDIRKHLHNDTFKLLSKHSRSNVWKAFATITDGSGNIHFVSYRGVVGQTDKIVFLAVLQFKKVAY